MKKVREAKKSLKLNAIYGIMLLLKILCCLTSVVTVACQIWHSILKWAVLVPARINFAMTQQDEFFLLLLPLRLLYIPMYMLLKDLALIGKVTTICLISMANYICYFYITRHRHIVWTVMIRMLQLIAAVIYHLSEHEEIIFPMV